MGLRKTALCGFPAEASSVETKAHGCDPCSLVSTTNRLSRLIHISPFPPLTFSSRRRLDSKPELEDIGISLWSTSVAARWRC